MLKKIMFTGILLSLFSSINAFYIIPIKIKVANTIFVSKGGGDFKDIALALASITDANQSNPYLIKIAEGEYEISSPLQMKEHVDIVGSGTNKTILSGEIGGHTNAISALIKATNNSTLNHLSIVNNGSSGNLNTGVYCSEKNAFILQDINITLTINTNNNLHYGVDSHNCNMAIFNSSIHVSYGTQVRGINSIGGIISIFYTTVEVSDSDDIDAIRSSSDVFVHGSTFTSNNGAGEALSISNDNSLIAYDSNFNGSVVYPSSRKCYNCFRSGLLLDENCHIPQ